MLNRTIYLISLFSSSLTAFFLGGLCVYSFILEGTPTATIALTPLARDISVDLRVYASSKGSRYYPWWCEAGGSISKANIVWFQSAEIAEREGYTLAKACR